MPTIRRLWSECLGPLAASAVLLPGCWKEFEYSNPPPTVSQDSEAVAESNARQPSSHVEWYDDAQTRKRLEVPLVDGKKHGVAQLWHPSGGFAAECEYKADVLDGPCTQYDVEGRMTEKLVFRDGRASGPATLYHPSGRRRGEGQYLDGRREGDWIFWHANGQIRAEGPFEGDREEGRWTSFHPNGEKEEEGEYERGMKAGRWKTWHANGQPHLEGNYEAGRMIGTWRAWSMDGKELSDVTPTDLAAASCGEELRAPMDTLRTCIREGSCIDLAVPVAEWVWSPAVREPLTYRPRRLRTETQPLGGESQRVEVGTQTYRVIAISDEAASVKLKNPRGQRMKVLGGVSNRHVLSEYQSKEFVYDTEFTLLPSWQTDAPEHAWIEGEYELDVDGEACVGVFLLRQYGS